jgi:drug/metabolite transporter (DMT)-like permease
MALFPLLIVLLSTFMHASWNLLARRQRERDIFLPLLLFVSSLGLVPVLLIEGRGEPILPQVWRYLVVTGVFQAIYYLGLLQGYKSGDFTVVYPVARALPVLVLAFVDWAQGQPPSLWGWVGMVLISVGCLLIPLQSWRDLAWAKYVNRMMAWVLLAAIGTVGYTLVDRAAAGVIRGGWDTAVRYAIYEFTSTFLLYWLVLKLLRYPTWQMPERAIWLQAALAGFFMFAAYALVLWAYQLVSHVSYVVALRQFSIVLGVVAGTFLFHEPAPRWRISMAVLIVLGVVLISLGG